MIVSDVLYGYGYGYGVIGGGSQAPQSLPGVQQADELLCSS